MKYLPCIICTHRRSGKRCLAFPEGIPYNIFSGVVLHDKILDDQLGGYVFVPMDRFRKYLPREKENIDDFKQEIDILKDEISVLFLDSISTQLDIEDNWNFIMYDIGIYKHNMYMIYSFSASYDKKSNLIYNSVARNMREKIHRLLSIIYRCSDKKRVNIKLYPDGASTFIFL